MATARRPSTTFSTNPGFSFYPAPAINGSRRETHPLLWKLEMSMSASAAIIVGVSYLGLLENDDVDFEEVLEGAVAQLENTNIEVHTDIEVHVECRTFDTPTDVFVGVVFYERPTDAQVDEAEAKVRNALPRLRELVGYEPSSDVETWLSVSID